MSVTAHEPPAPRPWQRRVVVALAAVALLHSVVLALWLAPSGPVRGAAGDRRLASYVNPYFAQAWAASAPSAQFVDERLRARAHVRDEATGTIRLTEWVDLTAAEAPALRHDLDPARVHVIARRLATNLNAAMFALSPAQRTAVRKSFTDTAVSVLRERLLAEGRRAAVETYMTYDDMTTRFASMYFAGDSGDRVLDVQYQVGRRTVPSRDDADAPKVSDVPFDVFRFGYRRAFTASYEAQVAFADQMGG